MRIRLLMATAAAMFSLSLAAHADTFRFTFGTTADAFSGSGTFTASSVSAGQFLITGISGTADTGNGVNRMIARLLAPGTFPTFSNGGTVPPNDNLLFNPQVNGGYFDQAGVSFALNNGAQINLFHVPFAPSDAFLLRANGETVDENVNVTVTRSAAVTPEPSTILLLSTGVLSVAGFVRRRVRV